MGGKNSYQNEEQNGPKIAEIAVVMVPFPAQGHLNQLLHLSLIISSYQIPVHYAGSTMQNRQAKLRLHGWDLDSLSKIHFHDFQLPPFSSPLPKPSADTYPPAHLLPLFDAYLHLHQPVSQLLHELATKFRRIVVVHDFLTSSIVQEVKSIPNAEAYAFIPMSTFYLFLRLWEGLTEKPFPLDSDFPRCIPTLKGIYPQEMENYIDYQYKCLNFQSGRLYNTSRAIEGKYLELLERLSDTANMKHFAIGPFNPVQVKNRSEEHRNGCLEWLDKQEKHSVIYVCFGSTISMTHEQIRELALGLEQSGQKFIWVLRTADKGDVFAQDEAQLQLPEGYEERMKNRGMVVRDWAPQLEILAHPSTGGFLSHCGWNSCMESISMGVPIVAWPMHSDQPRNTIFVTQVLKVGMVCRAWALRSELVISTAIEKAVTRLMASKEGEEIRKRAAELGERVRGSVVKGGVSHKEMESFIAYISRM